MTIRATFSGDEASERHAKIIELRSQLAEKFPASATAPARTRWGTGVEAFDGILDGGLAQGALTELVRSPSGMGSATLVHSLIEAAHGARHPLALVDGNNSFDQDGLAGEQLDMLLWIRCNGPKQAVHAADLLLRDGNLPLVVLDLVMCDERAVRGVASSSWHRLQRVAEDHETSALVVTPVPILSGIRHTLRLTNRFGLPTLDLLRDEVTASLQMETVRVRSRQLASGTFDHTAHVLSA